MTAALIAAAHQGDISLLFLVLAVLFVLGAAYLLFAANNVIGAVVAIVCAALIVIFLA